MGVDKKTKKESLCIGSSETGMALQSCAELVLGAGASYVSIFLSLEARCRGREHTLE